MYNLCTNMKSTILMLVHSGGANVNTPVLLHVCFEFKKTSQRSTSTNIFLFSISRHHLVLFLN